MKLILTRHGETVENANMICQGQTPGKLSEKGIDQAKKLALRLKDEKIDIIYTSDLARAFDTAKEIARYHPKIDLVKDTRMRERYFAEMQGKKARDDLDWNNLPEDVETDEDMVRRAKDMLDCTYSKHKGQTVLFVAHGGFNMALLTVIYNKPVSGFRSFKGIKNTSVYIFEIKEDNSHVVHLMNCVKHLE